jgi:hypothetical protein
MPAVSADDADAARFPAQLPRPAVAGWTFAACVTASSSPPPPLLRPLLQSSTSARALRADDEMLGMQPMSSMPLCPPAATL